VGIRPEDIEDVSIAAGAPPERRLATRVDLREALGSEVLAYFSVDAPPVLTEDTKELARDLGTSEDLEDLAQQRQSIFVARLDPRTGAREGQQMELAVDTSRLHFFDPEDGLAIRGA